MGIGKRGGRAEEEGAIGLDGTSGRRCGRGLVVSEPPGLEVPGGPELATFADVEGVVGSGSCIDGEETPTAGDAKIAPLRPYSGVGGRPRRLGGGGVHLTAMPAPMQRRHGCCLREDKSPTRVSHERV